MGKRHSDGAAPQETGSHVLKWHEEDGERANGERG